MYMFINSGALIGGHSAEDGDGDSRASLIHSKSPVTLHDVHVDAAK